MKYLVYELFSGVGLCNQIFSLETAIYLSNISKRKLIILIKNPLCNLGKASWDLGNLLGFFENNFLDYLPYGLEICQSSVPLKLTQIIENKEKTQKMKYKSRFSHIVFVDKKLESPDTQSHINEFLHSREKEYHQLDDYKSKQFIYINQSNASRCFYNFYTTEENYRTMIEICRSFKFKPFLYDIAKNFIKSLKATFTISLHLRFGDYFKDINFKNRYNNLFNDNIIPFIKGHITNRIKPTILIATDVKENPAVFDKIKKLNVNIVFLQDVIPKFIENYYRDNDLQYYYLLHPKKKEVVNAISEMLVCTYSDEFIGTTTSTFSNYIQYLRYNEKKSFYFYGNLEYNNTIQCKLTPVVKSQIPWVRYGARGGHPIGWHIFWPPPIKNMVRPRKMTIKGKTDGFGSQYQAIMSLIAYCDFKEDYEYVHTPMYMMHHNDKNEERFPEKMNTFTNLNSIYKLFSYMDEYDREQIITCKEGPIVHGSFYPEFFYHKALREKLRNTYLKNKIIELPYLKKNNNETHIVVHIRRGDVNQDRYPSRFISNQNYIEILKKVINKELETIPTTPQYPPEGIESGYESDQVSTDSDEIFFNDVQFPSLEEENTENEVIYLTPPQNTSKKIRVHIFSEGKPDDFTDIEEIINNNTSIEFHLQEDIQNTFHAMVEADILIVAKSSFSYTAALLNKNKIIGNLIENWWHKPLESWTKV